MSVDVNDSESGGQYFTSFDELYKEVQAKRGEADETPVETPEETPADEGETPVVEAAAEPQTPKRKSWQELQDEELPEDFPNGFYKNRKLADLARGISEAEGAMHRANERANKAEAALAAREVLDNMLAEKNKSQPQAPSAPSALKDPFEGFDLDVDLIQKPERVLRQLDDEHKKRIESVEEKVLTRVSEMFGEKERAQQLAAQRAELAAQMEQQATAAATAAFTKLNIPKEHWRTVADQIVPHLNNEHNPLYQKGGVLEEANYLAVIEENPLIKLGIASLVAAQEGRSVTPPAPVNPPGSKSPSVAPRSDKPKLAVKDGFRTMMTQMARGQGVTDPNEIEDLIQQAAVRANEIRSKRRSAR